MALNRQPTANELNAAAEAVSFLQKIAEAEKATPEDKARYTRAVESHRQLVEGKVEEK